MIRLSKCPKQKQTSPWKYTVFEYFQGGMRPFRKLAERQIMTNSSYVKITEDMLLCKY